MLPRERVLTALNHEEPDRVPLDLGSTPVTGICSQAYACLVAALGLPEREIRVSDVVQQLAEVDEDVLEVLGVDFRSVKSRPPSRYSPDIFPEGEYDAFYDQWGSKLRRPRHGGRYFDYAGYPIAEPTREALERFRWPDPDDAARYAGLAEEARQVRESTPYAVVGVCDIGADILARPQWLHGYEAWMVALAGDPEFAASFLDRLTDIAVRAWAHFLDEVGEYLDVAAFFDDLGMQDRPLISPVMYRNLVKPRHARIIACIKERTRARVLMHSCGAIRAFIPDLIDIGVDILNPIQLSAAGMGDTADLKRRYGRHLTFWGGGCDSQWVLPFGTLSDVRQEVRRRINDLGPGGGFVFAPVHNIQDDVLGSKSVELYRFAENVGRYPLVL